MPYMKVKLSFGKLVLVKVRAVNRDFFRVGKVEEAFLVYKGHKGNKRLSIPDSSVFYRSVGIMWADADDETNALVKPDFSTVSGFDAEKNENLLTRALTRPGILDSKENIMIGLIALTLVVVVIVGIITYKNGYAIEFIKTNIGTVRSAVENMAKDLILTGE